MKILGMDTSTMVSGLALLEGDKIIAEMNISQEKTHSEELLPMLETMMKFVGVEMAEVDAIAVSMGPGSFTGLRIGMTIAKTMAQFLKKPVYGVDTLEAMAHGVKTDGVFVPILDARGNRVYAAMFERRDGEWLERMPSDLFFEEDLRERLEGEDFYFVGEGVKRHPELEGMSQKKLYDSMDSHMAREVCYLAKRRLDAGDKGDSVLDLSPKYLRKSQAEMDFEKRRSKN